MLERTLLDCAVSSGGGEVSTIDIDRERLCTGDVGISSAEGAATSSAFFTASSGVHPQGFSRCADVDDALIDMGLCEL